MNFNFRAVTSGSALVANAVRFKSIAMSKPMTRWRCPTHAMASGRNRHTDTMGHYITLVVRTKGNPAAMAPAVENANTNSHAPEFRRARRPLAPSPR